MAKGKKTGHGKLKRAKWAQNYNAKKGLKHRRMAKRAALLSKFPWSKDT